MERMGTGRLLLDLRMLIMDGLERLRTIRQAGFMTPVIMMTAAERPSLVAPLRMAGMSACLLKPLDGTLLKTTVEGVLRESPRPEQEEGKQ